VSLTSTDMFFLAAALVSLPASAFGCENLAPTVFVLSIDEKPITTQHDLSLATLSALYARVGHRPVHPILGFYVQTTAVMSSQARIMTPEAPSTGGQASCPYLEIRSELVAKDRRIEIASDLSRTPCLLRAATSHYEHHAAAASRALRRYAIDLSTKLGPEVDHFIGDRADQDRTIDDKLQSFVDDLLTQSLSSFPAFLVTAQKEVDTPEEVRNLGPCQET